MGTCHGAGSRIASSVIEQKSGAVDQGPRDVLGGGEPPYRGLLNTHLQIVPQADEHRIGLNRPLDKFELVAKRLQSRIRQ